MAAVGSCVAPDLPGQWGRGNHARPPEARLGKLVQFTKRGRTSKTRSQSAEPGEIVLFTGVRYERDGTPLPDKPAGAASGGKRRRG